MMEEALRALLLGSAPVAAPVGARINWGAHPQGQPLPAIVLTVVSDIEGLTLAGPDGLSEMRVQADCYALTHKAARVTARAVRDLLHGYHTDPLHLIELAGSRDLREGGSDEADRPFRASLDFIVTWRDA